jgi:hypothetical protein
LAAAALSTVRHGGPEPGAGEEDEAVLEQHHGLFQLRFQDLVKVKQFRQQRSGKKSLL